VQRAGLMVSIFQSWSTCPSGPGALSAAAQTRRFTYSNVALG
jgi:hypothetical protein